LNPETEQYLEKYQKKIQALSERFASGQINPQQFEALFSHYQTSIERLKKANQESSGAEDVKRMLAEGQSILIRRAHEARMIGYIIFTGDGQVLIQRGYPDYEVQEMLNMMIKERTIQPQRIPYQVLLKWQQMDFWATLFYGQYTMCAMILTHEPAKIQLQRIFELHLTFESANRNIFQQADIKKEKLVYPQEFFMSKAL